MPCVTELCDILCVTFQISPMHKEDYTVTMPVNLVKLVVWKTVLIITISFMTPLNFLAIFRKPITKWRLSQYQHYFDNSSSGCLLPLFENIVENYDLLLSRGAAFVKFRLKNPDISLNSTIVIAAEGTGRWFLSFPFDFEQLSFGTLSATTCITLMWNFKWKDVFGTLLRCLNLQFGHYLVNYMINAHCGHKLN